MRFSLFILIAFVLFAQAAYAETKPAPKLTKITGYGEYKLGTPISDYDLSAFSEPSENILCSTESAKCHDYKLDTVLRVAGMALKATLTLSEVGGKLESIMFLANPESQFPDLNAYDTFMMDVRQLLLNKYSHELVEHDAFATKSPGPKGWRMLQMIDEDGNMLSLEASGYNVFGLSYQTGYYYHTSSAAMKRLLEKVNGANDEGKL